MTFDNIQTGKDVIVRPRPPIPACSSHGLFHGGCDPAWNARPYRILKRWSSANCTMGTHFAEAFLWVNFCARGVTARAPQALRAAIAGEVPIRFAIV